jgi:hypothetical protein
VNNFSSNHVGHTSDEKPRVILGIGESSASITLYEATKLTTNIKAIVRKLKRQSWRNTDEN